MLIKDRLPAITRKILTHLKPNKLISGRYILNKTEVVRQAKTNIRMQYSNRFLFRKRLRVTKKCTIKSTSKKRYKTIIPKTFH